MIIQEVQISCVVLMSLWAWVLGWVMRHFTKLDPKFNVARIFLLTAAILLVVHFIIQYFLHKYGADDLLQQKRALINLFFGMPVTGFVNLSLLYLLRQGDVRKWIEHTFIAILLVGYALLGFALFYIHQHTLFRAFSVLTAFLYAILLLGSTVLQFIEAWKIYKSLKTNYIRNQDLLLRWTLLPMVFTAVIGVGVPILIFNTNLVLRAIYGLLLIAVVFFYMVGFLGYALSTHPRLEFKDTGFEGLTEHRKMNEQDEQILQAVAKFVSSRKYLQTGITEQEVVRELGIPRSTFSSWIRSTEYQKFRNWLTYLRIEESKRLLIEHPDWSNETIAFECGFASRTYFQRQFRCLVGTSPLKWMEAKNRLEK